MRSIVIVLALVCSKYFTVFGQLGVGLNGGISNHIFDNTEAPFRSTGNIYFHFKTKKIEHRIGLRIARHGQFYYNFGPPVEIDSELKENGIFYQMSLFSWQKRIDFSLFSTIDANLSRLTTFGLNDNENIQYQQRDTQIYFGLSPEIKINITSFIKLNIAGIAKTNLIRISRNEIIYFAYWDFFEERGIINYFDRYQIGLNIGLQFNIGMYQKSPARNQFKGLDVID